MEDDAPPTVHLPSARSPRSPRSGRPELGESEPQKPGTAGEIEEHSSPSVGSLKYVLSPTKPCFLVAVECEGGIFFLPTCYIIYIVGE